MSYCQYFYNIHGQTTQTFRAKCIWVSSRCTLYGCALSSADDLSLLYTMLYGLQKMIYICEEFGKKYGIKYNPKKSMCMKIGSNARGELPQLRLSGDKIEWVKKVGYQGLIVSNGSGSCLNQISGFEPENDTKSIVSIIGPQNVGPLEPLFDPEM